MRQTKQRIIVPTNGAGLYPITARVRDWLESQSIADGLLTLFIRHTSASLTVQENADPDVLRDLEDFFRRVVPCNPQLYRHTAEGPDDMPAHIRSALTLTQISIPLEGGRLALGTWQGLFVFEHRDAPHQREVALHLLGE